MVDKNRDIEKKTGYRPEDIIFAPIETPKVKDNRPPNIKQQRTIRLGFVLFVIGLLLLPFIGIKLFFVIVIACAILIAVGTLFRL